jgi:hypothetical protein
MQNGFFVGDELWLWIDSWGGKSEKQRLTTAILTKSRKRDLTICYTTQGIQQVNSRIRNITDFIAYPMMSIDDSYCRVEIFRGPRASMATRINPPIYFNCEPVYAIYNTYQEILPLEDNKTEEEIFSNIRENLAFAKYLKSKEKSDSEIIRYSNEIQHSINPDGITKESERQVEEVYTPL